MIWDFGSVVRSWGLLVLLCPVGWVGVWSGSVSRRGARVGAEGGDLGFSCEGMSFSGGALGRSDGV